MSKVRADLFTNRASDGAPNFPFGLQTVGVVTAAGFSGNGSGLTNLSVSNAATAGGLTGTPDIVVGIVTATSINVSGNVSAVDGTFTGDVSVRNLTGVAATFTGVVTYEDVTNIDSVGVITARSGINVTTGGIEVTAGICTFLGGLVEKFEDAGTTLALQTNNPLSDGNVILFTGNESGNTTINFTGVHSSLAQGENVSFTVIISPNGSGVINTVQVDGVAQTIQWSGGAVPTAGASGRDVYTFTLLKNGTTTTSYLVFGAATNYA